MAENGNGNGNGLVKQILVAACGVVVASMLVWAGANIVSLGNSVGQLQVHLMYTQQKEGEIVPREENEKRYQAIEHHVDDNETRITRVESYIYGTIAALPRGSRQEARRP